MKKGTFKAFLSNLLQSSSSVRFGVRSFKGIVFLLLWLLILPSCMTQRRVMNYLAAHPLPYDTVTVETIVYKDTTFYVPVPADTVIDSIKIVLPCPDVPVTYKSDTARVVGKYATAKAWIVRDRLTVKLTMNEAYIAFKVDSLAVIKSKTITITDTVTVREKYVPPFYKATLFISIIFLVIFLFIIFIALRK